MVCRMCESEPGTYDLLVLEKNADGLAVVDTADGFRKGRTNVENLKFGAHALVLFLWDGIGDHQLVDGRRIDARNGIAAKHAVSDEGINSRGALLLQELGGSGDGIRGVGQIINQNTNPIGNISHEHHSGILAIRDLRRTTFLNRLRSGTHE